MIGIALMCAALFCFSCLDATAKWVNRSVDPMVTVWARYMVSGPAHLHGHQSADAAGSAADPAAAACSSSAPFLLFTSTICNFFTP